MAKHKLERFAELGTFNNVIQPETGIFGKSHPIKGGWKKDVFKNKNPIVLELGCGKGEYTIGLSSIYPENNFIGVDIKGARIWCGAKKAHDNRQPNVAFLRTRIEFINSFFTEDEVEEIWITFPDPHTGKNNSNKRLTCPWFLNNYRIFLKDNGIIHLKTDNTELFDYTRRLVIRNGLELLYATSDLYSGYSISEALLIKTHYEKIFLNEGMKITYLAFRLNKEKIITNGPIQGRKAQ